MGRGSRALSLFCIVSIIPFNSFAETGETRKPLDVGASISADLLKDLTPPQRKTVEETVEKMLTGLYTLENVDLTPPPSEFDKDSNKPEFIPLSPIKSIDVGQELSSSRDAHGPRLTKDDWKSVAQTGTFVVPSKNFPGQNHVWKVTLWLQEGAESIQARIDDQNGKAMNHLIVHMPRNIFGTKGFTVRNGISATLNGLKDTLGLLVGFIEKKPKYSDLEVEKIIEKEKSKFLKAEAENASTAEFQPDLRLYNKKLMEKVSERVKKIEEKVKESWPAKEQQVRAETLKQLREQNVPEGEVPQRVADTIAIAKQLALTKAIETDEKLNEVHPQAQGIGKLLSDRGRTLSLLYEEEQKMSSEVYGKATELEKQIRNKHLIRGQSPKWVNERVAQTLNKEYQAREKETYEKVIKKLKEEGLSQDAFQMETLLKFAEEIAPEKEKELAKEKRVAAREYEINRPIWFSRNWEIEQGEDGKFFAKDYKTAKTSTATPFWRIQNGLYRTGAYFKAGNVWMLDQMVNGPLGLRAFVSKDPFYARNRVDPKTGEIIPDTQSKTHTLRSNLGALWKYVGKNRKEIEAKPAGFMPKGLASGLGYVTNEFGKGVLGSLGLAGLQTGLTAANGVLTTGGVLSSALWAPVAGVANYGRNLLWYDYDKPRENEFGGVRLPRAVASAVLGGPLEAGVGGLAAGVWNPGWALTHTVAGAWGTGRARSVYDFASREVLLRGILDPLGRYVFKRGIEVPGHEEKYFVSRESGPGLSQNFVHELPPKLALLGLTASLDSEGLVLWAEGRKNVIQEPKEKYKEAVLPIARSIGQEKFDDTEKAPGLKEIKESEAANTKALNKVLGERQATLNGIKDMYQSARGRVAITPGEFDKVLAESAEVTRDYYEKRVFPGMDDRQVNEFWNKKGLVKGDFMGATKQHMKEMYGEQVLTPFTESGGKFLVKAEMPKGAEEFLSAILEGREIDLTKVKITYPETEVKEAHSKIPYINADTLCSRGYSKIR
jgi:hypothetical protein